MPLPEMELPNLWCTQLSHTVQGNNARLWKKAFVFTERPNELSKIQISVIKWPVNPPLGVTVATGID